MDFAALGDCIDGVGASRNPAGREVMSIQADAKKLDATASHAHPDAERKHAREPPPDASPSILNTLHTAATAAVRVFPDGLAYAGNVMPAMLCKQRKRRGAKLMTRPAGETVRARGEAQGEDDTQAPRRQQGRCQPKAAVRNQCMACVAFEYWMYSAQRQPSTSLDITRTAPAQHR